MQQPVQWLILFLSTFFYFLAQAILILLLFNVKIEKRPLLVFSLINSMIRDLLLAAIAQYIGIVYIVLYIISTTLTFKYILKMKFLFSIYATSILIALSSVLQYSAIVIFKVVFDEKFDFNSFSNSFGYTALGRNIGNILLVIACLLIYYLKMNINLPKDINKKRMFGIIANTLLITIIIIPNMLYIEHSMNRYPLEFIIFNATSILLLFFVSIYNSIKSGELELKKEEAQFQKLYIKTLHESIEGLRGFKHDYNNVLQSISGYLSLNDIHGLKKYFQQIQLDSIKISSLVPLNNYVSNTPAIYGLLLSKISSAEINGIQFHINITSEINFRVVKLYDLCKILGILLDNALEAAVECEKKYVELNIHERFERKETEIQVINTFTAKIDIDKDKIFNNGYSTKLNHSGFGLWEVNKILSKYPNCSLKTYISDNIFTQSIKIV